MAQHLKYGGSTIERAILCRASANAPVPGLLPPPGRFAQEGTIAHSVLERALKSGVWDVSYLIGIDDVSREMADAVNVALDYVKSVLKPGDILQTEQFLPYARFPDIAGGTADICIVREHHGGMNEIIDFKYGFNPVESTAPQMRFYALCAFGADAPVKCTVIQPRGFHESGPIRCAIWDEEYVQAFEKQVVSVIEEAEAPYAPYNPSFKACRYCPSASQCPALADAATETAGLRNIRNLARGHGSLPDLQDMDTDRLESIVQAAPLMREWLDAAYEQLRIRAMSGQHVHGYKLVEAQTKRVWRQNQTIQKIAATLSHASGLPAGSFINQKLRPITDVQADIKRELVDIGMSAREASSLAKSVISLTVDKPKSSDLTLVPRDDPREEINRAARDFAGVTFRNDNNG